MIPRRFRALACLLFLAAPAVANAGDGFYLKNGDRVVFYGDSITDQRLYTTFTETFVVTRFPKLDVTFVHSGWGGDSVRGGGGGPVDLRLKRDVLAYKPTVMTVMLGMNDGGYQSFKQNIFDTYAKGSEHIVATMKREAPGIRITLIQPSPFDDVTRKPNFEGGYNAVLVRYGAFLKELAKKNGLDVADLNTGVTEATKKALASDPKLAQKLNPDRVHPAPAGQILMAAELLKAWKAPAIVSMVAIKAGSDDTITSNTKVTDVKAQGDSLAWTQLDEALPFPLDLKDPIVALAMKSSDFVRSLDEQPLKVGGLKAGEYVLKIDGAEVGTFSAERLARGINLATKPTPMARQAAEVHRLTLKRADIHNFRWRTIEVPFEHEDQAQVKKACEAFDAIEAGYAKKQHEAAEPKPHHFELSPKG
jgi:lysophospholipase L1-like esterase